jgi:anthranilate synthase/aminodeoxychorismate synthase-like glutamine amidotransferase
MRILVVDNYDSFTYNLVQYLGELGADVDVVRNDQAAVADLVAGRPDRVVISPGPCTPNEAGISLEAARAFPEAGIPLLGVCLGHQALAQAFGGRVVRDAPVHGKSATVTHDGQTIYSGLPNPLTAGRYHSLVVDRDSLPGAFEATATAGDVVMGIRHRELPAEGVQFHPESVLTEHGKRLLANFLSLPDVSDNVELVRRLHAGFFEGRWSDPELMAPELVYRPVVEVGGKDEYRGPEGWVAYIERFVGEDFVDLSWSVTSYREHAGRVIARIEFEGRGPASGAPGKGRVFVVYTISDGRIVRMEDFTSSADALAAAESAE